jgi:hypothetical protein
MSLYKRMGFTAIYMPDQTCKQVMEKVSGDSNDRHAININGTALYRPLRFSQMICFGSSDAPALFYNPSPPQILRPVVSLERIAHRVGAGLHVVGGYHDGVGGHA